jgi:nucleotide-binding universal stress UspA family protein
MTALDFAAELARERSPTLYIIHVVRAPFQPSAEVPVEPQGAAWERDAMARLDAVARQHVNGKANFSLVVKTGDPFTAIMQAERELNRSRSLWQRTAGREPASFSSAASRNGSCVNHCARL